MSAREVVGWVLGVLAGIILVVALCIGGYKLYWVVAKKNVQNQYGVNTQTQQYQAGLISQERDLVLGWNHSDNPGQKSAIKDQFCAQYLSINPVPPDLEKAYAELGCQ